MRQNANCYIVLIMGTLMEAAKLGEKKYLGAPCRRGHDGWRYTTTGGCIQCLIESNIKRRAKVNKLLAEAKK